MTPFSAEYLALGVLIGIWQVVKPNSRGWLSDVRSLMLAMYLLVPAAYQPARVDAFVVLGLATQPLSMSWVYRKSRSYLLAAMACIWGMCWIACSLILFAGRGSEWSLFAFGVPPAVMLWIVRTTVASRKDRSKQMDAIRNSTVTGEITKDA